MHWFFDPAIAPESKQVAKSELQHFASLRIRRNDEIVITNGQGLALIFQVSDPKSGGLIFVRELPVKRSELSIHLVQALAKGDRDEMALQAAVELGVRSVTPWQADNSISNWNGKEEKGVERWRQIAISATKQSQQSYLPEILPLSKTSELNPMGKGILLRPDAERALSDLGFDGTEFTVVVGPEGGISAAEIELLEASGFISCRLGSSVLRTSTAGPAAIAAIQALSGAWSNA